MSSLSIPNSLSRHGFFADVRALAAVARREWTIFLRYPSWIFAMFIWPIVFPAGYILTGRALAGPDGSGLALFTKSTGIADFLGYIAIGTTVWMWQNIVLWDVGLALRQEQMRGTLETNWMSPTWRFSFLLGNGISQSFVVICFLIVSALEYGLLFRVHFNGNLALVILTLLAAVPSIYGLGFAFASLVITAKEANTFVFLLRGLIMIFCGITFPISLLPGWMHGIANWLPQTYMIDAVRRAALAGASFQELAPDLAILLAFGAGWMFLGFVFFSWMERRARQTGAIGQY